MGNFDKQLQAIIDSGTAEARSDGSATVEAQHLLLALAAGEDTNARQVLASVGLDHQAIRDALDRELERSLIAAGVAATAAGLPRPTGAASRPTHLGTSVRLAFQRGFRGTPRRTGLQPAHVLVGILRAEVGTVPRALALAGIDRADLIRRAIRAIPGEGE